jgi:hypothetical protein
MPAQLTTSPVEGSLLLGLLRYAGWRLEVRKSDGVAIRASRDGVEVRAAGRTVSEATGVVFARAMRSGSTRQSHALGRTA